MNGKTILLAFVLVSFYFAGIASAQVIPIAACGTLAVPGATYQLTVNITGFAGGNCMNIVAGGITLDCLGNTINGVGPGVPTPDVGVFLNGVAGVTVRNCQVNQFPFGVYLLDSSFNTVSNNNVSANGWGITLDTDSNNNTVSNNLVTLNNVPAGNAFGISIRDSVNNIFFNNLINNTVNYQNVGVTVPNFFNTTRQPGQRIYSPGTDIGGNYWSNPAGNGYSDSCTDSNRDGFCDTPPPFTLPDGNTDNLPLSNKYVDTTPPVITVISPQNTVYNTTSFWANVTTNESCSNAYYSLNGGPNTNLTLLNSTYFFGNVTTSIIGGNSIVFYAVDLAGNIGVSNTTYFTVSTPAIAGCPITINIPGNYYLTNNLGSAYSQTCITVNSSNVVLDCRGRSITGNGGSYGVDNPRFSNVTVRNCVINTYGSGIRFGQDKYGGANSGLIENNILNSCSDFGVLLYRAESNVILNNTAQNCGREGFIVYYYSYANIVVNNTAQNNGYGFNLGDIAQINQLYGNRAKNNSHYGIELIWAQGNVVHDNIVDGNGWAGIFLQSTDTYGTVDNVIYNNLFNNTMNVEWLAENIVFGNQWNTGQQPGTRIYSPGTEIGGNYWSGPSGGYSDTCTDNNTDGFCDDAYYLADGNIDYLPLSDEYPTDTTPPVITILSPQNTTYSTSTVGLTFTVNEPTSWIGYSLDGAANITITGNTTLSGLSDGPHNVIVYARDTSNNLGASVVVYFSVSLPANPISACPYSMNSPGTYVLTQNLTASGTCITVNSANVVLDCMGHSITGVGTTGIVFGIYNPASDNVTVKNCVVRGYNAEAFEYGIEYGVQNCYAGSGPVNGLIYNNTLDSNWQGIYLCGCASDLISNNTVNNSGNSGIQFDHGPSSGILVTNNVVTNTNGNGIGTGNADSSNITNNIVTSNIDGIGIGTSGNIRVEGNTITSNSEDGIHTENLGSHLIINNNITSNSRYGISVTAEDHVTITQNNVNGPGQQYGIYLSGDAYATVVGNNVSSNTISGLYITGVFWFAGIASNIVSNNTLTNNGNANVYLEGPAQYAGECVGGESCYGSPCSYDQYYCENYLEYPECTGCTWQLGEPTYPAGNNAFSGNLLTGGTYGFDIREITTNSFIGNNITGNDYGIRLNISSANNFTSNTVYSNNVGIYIHNSSGNLIYNNYFANTVNAYDDPVNIWNVTKTAGTNIIGGSFIAGNYWSDYAGVDTDSDGIGDTLLPYNSGGNIMNGGDYAPLISSACVDNDGDGYSPYVNPSCPNNPLLDCNDSNPNVHPRVNDICNNIDDNGDGQVDQAFYWCGHSSIGACKFGRATCTAGVWGSCIGAVYPVTEVCHDSIDNDCDRQTDEGCPPPSKPGKRPTIASGD